MLENFQKIIDYIKGLYPETDPIVLHEPVFAGNEKKYVLDAIDSTFVSSVGKYVNMFEQRFAEFIKVPLHSSEQMDKVFTLSPGQEVTCHAVACVNGTAGLHIALQLVGVSPCDEVLVSPLTFIASVNPIRYCGAEPVFVDVDRKTLGMSPDDLEEFLGEHTEVRDGVCYNVGTGRVVRACLPVHVFGHPCEIDRIVEICDRYNIEVVEDAAESIGSYYKGIHTGLFGKVGVFSFNGNKTITTGAGGMLVTKDNELAKKAKHLTTQAKIPHKWDYKHDEIGYNYRMPNINAALGVAQLESLGLVTQSPGHPVTKRPDGLFKSVGILGVKRQLAALYEQFFEDLGIEFFIEPMNCVSNYWLNNIVFDNRKERDTFLEFAFQHGVYCRPCWELISELELYKENQKTELSNAMWLADRVGSLPSYMIKQGKL